MIDRYSNISYSEKIFCHIRYWKDFIEMTNSVKKAFENSNLLLWNVFNNKLPFKAKLQNGKEIELRSFNALYLVSKVYKIEHITFDDDDEVVVTMRGLPPGVEGGHDPDFYISVLEDILSNRWPLFLEGH